MDRLTNAYYELTFQKIFFQKTEKEFQNLFSEMMELRYPGDFIRVRAWGSLGDKKNDGYLKSERTVFQVYAPLSMSSANTIKKIDENFAGAVKYWEDKMDCWIFVQNSREGIGPEVLKKLLDLQEEYPHIKIKSWGLSELHSIVFALKDDDVPRLLGAAPTDIVLKTVGYEDLRLVLKMIEVQEPITEIDLRPVPVGKIRLNQLSADVETLIKAGMRKSALVEKLFREFPDPLYGDKIALAFIRKYQEFLGSGLSPDEIFMRLQDFAGGEKRQEPKHEAAVLAIIAHLFELCDIFERPGDQES
jgi:hypothetical protein